MALLDKENPMSDLPEFKFAGSDVSVLGFRWMLAHICLESGVSEQQLLYILTAFIGKCTRELRKDCLADLLQTLGIEDNVVDNHITGSVFCQDKI